VTAIVTGKHTEIVLNRGIGLHTILGLSIDCGVGEVLDKSFTVLMKYKDVFDDEEQVQDFIDRYNSKSKGEKIPSNYFEFLKDTSKMPRGKFIEMLARYGDPSEIELPLGFKN